MLFHTFAEYLQKLEATNSRLAITEQLAELYKQLAGEEIREASNLLQGQLVPAYESLEFQLSVKMVLRALARISDLPQNQHNSTDLFGTTTEIGNHKSIEQKYKQLGDLGTLVEQILKDTKHTIDSRLTLTAVYDDLIAIAQESGAGSQERKLEGLVQLLQKLDATSAKFIARIILGRLRLGFSTMTMIDALSWSVTGGKEDSKALELAYQRQADIGKLAETYLAGDTSDKRHAALADYTIEVGVPIVPALCQRLNSAAEIIDKMGEVMAEPKFDGLRIQIHVIKQPGKPPLLRTFTRNLENNSETFPELKDAVAGLNCESCVLDSEAIGYHRETGQLRTFQETITRKRKHGIEETAENIPVRFYIFDVLSLNGESLLDKKLRERKDRLKNLFKQNEVLYQTEYIVTNDPVELRTFHEEQLAQGLEGAVIKQIDSVYQPGRKGWSWVKIKEEEGTRGKLTDTLDCVVLGYYAGRGKRTQFGLGAFLVGVLAEDQTLKTIAKIGTGLSDEQFKDLKDRCQPLIVPDQPANYHVDKALIPDVWVQPQLVVEIAADEITRSPVHTAGVALRFPRLVKFRDDKGWENATTVEEVQEIHVASAT
jgi:DNA ligase-1